MWRERLRGAITHGGKHPSKHEEVRGSLPDDLQPVFDSLVENYKFYATKHHGTPFVSFVVLADLVKDGVLQQRLLRPKQPLQKLRRGNDD